MNRSSIWVLGFLSLATPTLACEPILPLAQLLAGSTALGPVLLTRSLLWLLAAIAIKCLAFTCFEKRLSWGKAAWFMFVANIVSTIPGALIAVITASGPLGGVLLALPIIFVLGWKLRQRTSRLPQSTCRLSISGGTAMIAFVLFFVASMIFYGFAQSFLENRDHANYWFVKLLFATLVACTGIVMSAVLEESVIAGLATKSAGHLSFYTPVFRANYITLGAILFITAVSTIPTRLRSPGFLIGWLDQIWTSIRLG